MRCSGFGVLINSNDARLQGGSAECLISTNELDAHYTCFFCILLSVTQTISHEHNRQGPKHRWPTNTCILSLLPSQLLLSRNNNMLLLPSNTSSLEGKKYLIVFLPFTAAVSRSVPLKVDEGSFLFSLLVFVREPLWACEMTTCTEWTRHYGPLNTERCRLSMVSTQFLLSWPWSAASLGHL